MLQLLYANWTGLNEAIYDGNRVDNVLVVESSEAFATAAFPHANRHPTPSGRSVGYTNALSDNSEASVKSNGPVQAFPRTAYGFDWHRYLKRN
jgi:hypothetical protein